MERLNKLEFFRKLGYSQEDVVRVLGKLGDDALVNDMLQELIQTGSRPRAQEGPANSSIRPLLVPRGCCGVLNSARQGVGPALEEACDDPASSLRPIVIDGSNVAMSHGNKEAFSCRGIRLAVDWFRDRGHTYIKVFVPSWRKEPSRSDPPIREQHLLEELEQQAVLVYTPSRKVNGKRVVCYDDRYIVKVAYEKDGVIVSNDNYRDLQSENPEWKWFIEQRLLMFSFVNDRFMPPDDPLGRRGPTLSNFLSRKPRLPEPSWQPCPYGKKCTFGNKCKFYHPERPHRGQLAVADELRAKTLVWHPGGAEEPRPPSITGRPAAARPVPGEPGTHSPRPVPLPLSPSADLAALRGSFSRLALSDDPASGLHGPDWLPTGGRESRVSLSLCVGSAATPRLPYLPHRALGPQSPFVPGDLPSHHCPQGQSSGGQGLRDVHSDRPPQLRSSESQWARLPCPDRSLSHSAWTECTWGHSSFGGASGSAKTAADGEVDPRARARTAFCSVFPRDQVNHVVASVPDLADLAGLICLPQRYQRSDSQLGDP